MIQVGSSSAMPMSFTIWGWSSFFISTAGRHRIRHPAMGGGCPLSRTPNLGCGDRSLPWSHGQSGRNCKRYPRMSPEGSGLPVSSSPGIYIQVVDHARIQQRFFARPPLPGSHPCHKPGILESSHVTGARARVTSLLLLRPALQRRFVPKQGPEDASAGFCHPAPNTPPLQCCRHHQPPPKSVLCPAM